MRYRYKLRKHMTDSRQDELIAICRQYRDLKRSYINYDSLIKTSNISIMPRGSDISDPTARAALNGVGGLNKIFAIEKAAKIAGNGLSKYIIANMCDGKSYNQLLAKENIPCGSAKFSEMRRHFLIILNKLI